MFWFSASIWGHFPQKGKIPCVFCENFQTMRLWINLSEKFYKTVEFLQIFISGLSSEKVWKVGLSKGSRRLWQVLRRFSPQKSTIWFNKVNRHSFADVRMCRMRKSSRPWPMPGLTPGRPAGPRTLYIQIRCSDFMQWFVPAVWFFRWFLRWGLS